MTSFRPAVILFAKTAGSIHRLGAPRSAPPAPSEWPLLSHSPPLAGSFHFPLSLSTFLSPPSPACSFHLPLSLGFLSLSSLSRSTHGCSYRFHWDFARWVPLPHSHPPAISGSGRGLEEGSAGLKQGEKGGGRGSAETRPR